VQQIHLSQAGIETTRWIAEEQNSKSTKKYEAKRKEVPDLK